MRMATQPHPRFVVALMLAAVILTPAGTIKNVAATSLKSPASHMRGANRALGLAAPPDSPSRAPQASRSRVVAAYGKLPLSFEINQGQTDSRVTFLSRGSGYSLFLTGDEAVLVVRKGSSPSKSASEQRSPRLPITQLQGAMFTTARARQHPAPITNAVLRMKLVGGNTRAQITGLEELPGTSNYFMGNDPRKWRTNVPNYAKVKCANVYPGVDLVYYGNHRQLEYDFVVQAGADPRQIGLAVQPQSGKRSSRSALRIDRNGDLLVGTSNGEVRFHKPIIYQPGIDAEALTKDVRTREVNLVEGKYLLRGNRISFEVANYDKTRPLVIDPTLAYSTYLGGSGGDQALGIAVDATGNAYVTGVTFSSDFPATPGAFQTHNRGDFDGFVSKLNAAGSALAYSTYLGGSGEDQVWSIAVDSSGSAYVTGQTFSSDFPITQGAFQTTLRGAISNAFISKLNAAGSALLYSTYLGGSFLDSPSGIAVDVSGNAYIAGLTESDDFPTTPGAFQTTFAGPRSNEDAFITKTDATGSALVYSTYLGGNNLDEAHGIALDALGNAYVTGFTVSSDFPITPSAFQTTFSGHGEAFVSKLNPAGSTLLYSSYLGGMGGSSGEEGASVAVDGSGNCYVTGGTGSSNFPVTPGAFQTTLQGPFNAFVSKFNAVGSALLYSTYLGGNGDHDQGLGLALDASGGVFVTGLASSSDFPTTSGAFQTTYGGNFDAFFSKLNTAGSALLYSTYLGGSEPEDADLRVFGGIAVDVSGNAYVTGGTDSSNFPTTPGALQTHFTGSFQTGGEAFVSKFSFPAGIPFSLFGGGLLIDPDAGVFYLSGGFKLGPGGSINPVTESVTFSVGDYSVTLPPGSFVKYKTGYVYQKRVNHIFLCLFIKFTSTPGSYALLANRIGGTLTSTTSPLPVTLAIGDDNGTAQMKAKFD